MDFPTYHQQVTTSTRKFALKLMLLQFSLYIALGICSMITIHIVLSGDSTTPKNNSTTLPSTSKSVSNVVNIEDTTAYTAMQLNLDHLNPLELNICCMIDRVQVLEDQVDELYDMIHMLMEYVDFDDVAHHEVKDEDAITSTVDIYQIIY